MNFRQPTYAHLTIVLLSGLLLSNCGGSATKSNLLEEATTMKTDSITQTRVFAAYHRNFYPEAVDNDVVRAAGEKWQEGGSETSLTFYDAKSQQFANLRSLVKLNDKALPYAGAGSYYKSLPKAERITFDVTDKKGKNFVLMLDPAPAVKIISINGKPSYTKISFDKDITLKLANPSGTEDSYLRVSMLVSINETSSFQTLGIFKSADLITIPKDVLRHVGFNTTQNSPLFNVGDNWVLVERLTSKDSLHQGINLRTLMHAMDARKIGIAKDTQNPILSTEVSGIVAKDMSYKFLANNALTTKPIEMGKRFALAGFNVHGDVAQPTGAHQFPVFSEQQWQHYMAYMYGTIRKAMGKAYGIEFLPVSAVVAAKAYQQLVFSEDTNTPSKIRKNFSQGRVLIPPYIPATVDFKKSWHDTPHQQLMAELNVDGLMFIDVALNAEKSGDFVITPTITINIVGQGQSAAWPMVNYASGIIKAPAGRAYNPTILSKTSALSFITRSNHVVSAMIKGINHMASQQEQQHYQDVWKLR